MQKTGAPTMKDNGMRQLQSRSFLAGAKSRQWRQICRELVPRLSEPPWRILQYFVTGSLPRR